MKEKETMVTRSSSRSSSPNLFYAQQRRWIRMSDRRLLQTFLGVSIFFFFNLLRLWYYNHPDSTFLEVLPSPAIELPIMLRSTVVNERNQEVMSTATDHRHDDDDYQNIFCRNNNIRSRHNHHRHPIFLWGIPSTTSEFEIGRRKLLRSTYLNYYHISGRKIG